MRTFILLKLPVNPYIVLEFETRIMDETITLPGYLVRRNKQEEELYEYGVKFCFEEYEQMYLTKLLNDMTIRLPAHNKRGAKPPFYFRFCKIDIEVRNTGAVVRGALFLLRSRRTSTYGASLLASVYNAHPRTSPPSTSITQ
jgi:hypothetical protein